MSEDFALLNFEECTGANNRPEPYVRMTRDGFTLLCMGFTGKEAMHWKIAYINAFNKMEQVLIEQPEILSHNHLLQFAIKTLDLMRDHTLGEPARPRTEQVVCNYLAVESLDAANPEQIKQALNFLQGQIIGEGVAAKSLPSVAGSSIARTCSTACCAPLMTRSCCSIPSTTAASKAGQRSVQEHMANTLAATSRQTRELLGYVASRATRSPSNHAPPTNPYSTDWRFIMATPSSGKATSARRRSTCFPNGNNSPRQLLRLNVMFDNSIPDGQGGYKDRGGFWCSVEWWHQDAQRFAELFAKGMRVKVEGRAIMDRWPDKESGEEVQALKVEASRISILPHRLAEVTLLPSTNGQATQHQQTRQVPPQPTQQDARSQQDYDSAFDDDIPM